MTQGTYRQRVFILLEAVLQKRRLKMHARFRQHDVVHDLPGNQGRGMTVKVQEKHVGRMVWEGEVYFQHQKVRGGSRRDDDLKKHPVALLQHQNGDPTFEKSSVQVLA